MDHLNQSTDTNLPATIAQAFSEWQALQAEILAALDADTPNEEAHAREWIVENHAVTLPAITAQDVWHLLAMTSDENNHGPRSTQDQVVSRAHAEIARPDRQQQAVSDLVVILLEMPADKATELRNAFAAFGAIRRAKTADEAVRLYDAAKV